MISCAGSLPQFPRRLDGLVLLLFERFHPRLNSLLHAALALLQRIFSPTGQFVDLLAHIFHLLQGLLLQRLQALYGRLVGLPAFLCGMLNVYKEMILTGRTPA
ncbi:MAG: hypothetical protein C0390_06550 [Syntrophus sp. (in: bacteria)]|nr:hypothetical protein [Syntrophus sp. (in: bacteria)]